MPPYRIAVIGGDGIGPEVIESAIGVIDAAIQADRATIEWNRLPWNCDYFKKHGRIMPADGFDQLLTYDAIFLGALGSPDVPDTETVHGMLLPLRRKFNQYVNLRPAYLFDGITSPLRGKEPGSIDMVFYRENTEGEYAPVGGKVHAGFPHEIAIQSAVFTRYGCERIMRAAFAAARRRRNKVTSITKSNALAHSMTLWDDVFADVAAEFPDVQSHALLVDAAAMDLVRKPETFDVLVASNLFGDILTDISAIVTGSLGLAASGNINPEKKFPSLFEPVHGSAPDIAGQGIANPMAAMLSACLMLEHLELPRSAAKLKDAVAAVLKEGKTLTPDLGGKAKTSDVTKAVRAAL